MLEFVRTIKVASFIMAMFYIVPHLVHVAINVVKNGTTPFQSMIVLVALFAYLMFSGAQKLIEKSERK